MESSCSSSARSTTAPTVDGCASPKLRGSPFRSGYHDFTVRTGGLVVFPRLIAAEHRTELLTQPMASGIVELDTLLAGGIECSTATLLVGPAGTGKSAIATQFA